MGRSKESDQIMGEQMNISRFYRTLKIFLREMNRTWQECRKEAVLIEVFSRPEAIEKIGKALTAPIRERLRMGSIPVILPIEDERMSKKL